MQEKLKEIVSTFIKVPADQIGPATPIDRSAVQSSILLHRMFARLAEEGIVMEDYSTIKIFGDLEPAGRNPSAPEGETLPVRISVAASAGGDNPESLGIDIEEIAALPKATDFRRDEFYMLNFSPEEIAYCILQPDSYASFTGLFAVKEAIFKAGGRRRGEPFNTIHILHSPEGKPLYPGFAISISHTAGLAVAVAARSAATLPPAPALKAILPAARTGGLSSWAAWIAVVLSVIALLLALIHHP